MLLGACATSESAPSTIPASTASKPSDKGRLEIGQITSQALANNLIGDPATREYRVYLPPSYDSTDIRYPVVYALHGYVGDNREFLRMPYDLEELLKVDEVQEMIFVFVDGSNYFKGSLYLSSPTIGDYESYIVSELVDHIDDNYRTLSNRDSRGIIGCSMGGDGAAHLALKYPDVFSVAVPMSGLYDNELDPYWEQAKEGYTREPEELRDFHKYGLHIQYFIAGAAGVASNPDKPPLYLDMPFEIVDGEPQIIPEVKEKLINVSPIHDAARYLNQPVRLRGLMIYHGERDDGTPVELAREFDKRLTELGIEHEYLESDRGHCDLDLEPALQFFSNHLVFR